MTLILTCLTQDYILQVADRRVTLADGTLKDDDTNKAVFYCGGYAAANFAVAYTGPDEMEGESTAEWIGARMMAESNIESAMEPLRNVLKLFFDRVFDTGLGDCMWLDTLSQNSTDSTLCLYCFEFHKNCRDVAKLSF